MSQPISNVHKMEAYVFPGVVRAEDDSHRDPFASIFSIMLIGASKEKEVKLARVPGYFKPMFVECSDSVFKMFPIQFLKMTQGIKRTVNGDSRGDLAFFEYAITAVSTVYSIQRAENKETMSKFWELAKFGMQSMAFTYGELEEDRNAPVSFKRWEKKIEEILSSAGQTDKSKGKPGREMVEKVKQLWSIAEISRFNQDLDRIEKEQTPTTKLAYMRVFEDQLEKKSLAYMDIVSSEISLLH